MAVNSAENTIIGAILLGGRSSRMGRPKHAVTLPDGATMLQKVVQAMQPLCGEIVLLGNRDLTDLPAAWTLLRDRRPGLGPMAGIEALLLSGLSDRYLVATCDQPLLTTALLEMLVVDTARDICAFESAASGFAFPFPGVYAASLLSEIQLALDEGRRSLQQFLKSPRARRIPASPEQEFLLQSINTPEELAAIAPRFR